jgi:hypothetical protein
MSEGEGEGVRRVTVVFGAGQVDARRLKVGSLVWRTKVRRASNTPLCSQESGE